MVHQNAQKGPLECTRRSTITVCLINIDIDLDTVKDLNKFCYPISYTSGHAYSKITLYIIMKVHFFHAKNLPAELPGYGLDKVYLK